MAEKKPAQEKLGKKQELKKKAEMDPFSGI